VSRARTVQVGTGKRSRSTLAIKPLGELCEMDRRHVRPDDPDSKRLPFVGVEHIASGNGMIDLDSSSRVGNQKSTAYGFDKRHVLYGKLRPYLNKVATPDFSGKCSTELVPLLPRNGINRDFLAYLLRRQETVDFAMASVTGSRMPRTDMKTLLSMKVPAPPLDEQRQIVSILNRAARIEHLRAQAQERLREFILALFVKMFGDPATNPMQWPVAPLGDIATVVGGGTPRRSNNAYFSGSIPWATPTDVTALDGLLIQRTAETITESGLRESSARLVPAGTVLLTSRATIGFTAIAAQPMTTNQGFANLTCGKRLLPEYLAIWLRLRRDRLIQLAGGTTFKEISKSTLKKIEVPLPEIKRQRRFANLIGTAHATASITREGSASAATLSASLMSHLLGGNA